VRDQVSHSYKTTGNIIVLYRFMVFNNNNNNNHQCRIINMNHNLC
jgi:hypothetical protein